MALFNVNLIIKETRKARGMTQEQLAEGICSRETVVKLERSERKPNWFVLRELFRRLGLESHVYQQEMSSQDEVAKFQRINQCYGFIGAYKFDEAKAQLDAIDAENAPVWQSGLWLEMLLRLKAYFYSYELLNISQPNHHADPALAAKCAMECLRLTRPDFDENKIPEYFLAVHELQTICCLAMAYMKLEKENEAIKIWYNVKANIEEKYAESFGPNSTLDMWYRENATRLCDALILSERFEECLKLADEVINSPLSSNAVVLYINFLTLKANALKGLGRMDESREFYKKVLLFYYLLDGQRGINFEATKKAYEEQSGEQLDLSIPW
ncbi:MAG: helix-turn-helix transcriptional regulator [Defluviitaleaceae bacterium]|nr:helix-turn-helix transcriptional regulator [Defluviitaleaceae bacterium]